MDILKEITIEQVLSWKPCGDHSREELLKISGGRTSLTPLEILALDIPVDHRFWVLLREEIIPEKELHLLACEFAVAVLPIWEKAYPEDKRPRQAIEAKRKWVAGEIDDDELAGAGDAARAAAWDAAWAGAGAGARAGQIDMVKKVLQKI